MKVYDAACPIHGEFEAWVEELPIVCTKLLDNGSQCASECVIVWKKFPGCQPDPLWSGVMTDMGYVTSHTQYKAEMKKRGMQYAEKGDEAELKMIQARQDRIIAEDIHQHTVDTVIGQPYTVRSEA